MDKDYWYRKRNDRINRVNNVQLNYLTNKPVAVIIPNKNINRYSDQLMAIISINILSRWCNNISIEISEAVDCCLPNYFGSTLKDVIESIVYKNDPYGNFQIRNNINKSEIEYFLIIGETQQNYQGNSVYIDSCNWVYGISNSNLSFIKPVMQSFNPIGPTLAASAGIAVLFKNYIEHKNIGSFRRFYSIYNFTSDKSIGGLVNPETPNCIDLGKIYQIGCGAVGSCFDFLLSCTNFSGNVYLIDYDYVKFENLASSLIFDFQDSKDKREKIQACEQSLKLNKSIKASAFKDDYSEFIKKINYSGIDYPNAILCLANEKNIWSTIQHNLPPLVLHATTSVNWGVNFGRHVPFNDWCIVCRFGIEDYEYVPKCSTGILKTEMQIKDEPLGALPFLSPAAAALVLAELIKKSSYDQYPLIPENFIQYSMNFDKMNEYILLKMNKKETCPICSLQTPEDYLDSMKDKIVI